jgi:hypothetical protein
MSQSLNPKTTDSDSRIDNLNLDSSATKNPSDWIMLASLNEALLDKEHKLANDRIVWTLTSQSILLGAFCILALNKDRNKVLADQLLPIIPVFALIAVGAGLVGFAAAQIVVNKLEGERTHYQDVLKKLYDQKIPDLGVRRGKGWIGRTRVLGHFPSIIIMIILGLLWIFLIKFKISIDFGSVS